MQCSLPEPAPKLSDVTEVSESRLPKRGSIQHFKVLLNQVLFLDWAKMDLWVAFRNTIGVVLSLVVGFLMGWPVAGLVIGIGALVVSYSDGRVPYIDRARRMLLSSVLCALSVFAGAFSFKVYLLGVVLATVWAFGAGMSIVLGSTAADLALFSLVMFLIFAAEQMPLERAALFGLLTLMGGLLQTGLSLIFWPIRRYEPERHELGKLFLEFSQLANAAFRSRNTPPGSSQINRAHEILATLGQNHDFEGDRYWALLNQAERIRLCLLSLPRLQRRIRRATQEAGDVDTIEVYLIELFLKDAAQVLGFIGQILLTRKLPSEVQNTLRHMESLAHRMRAEKSPRESAFLSAVIRDALFQMDALAGQLRAAMDLATKAIPVERAAFYQREAAQPWALRLFGTQATLRANLTFQSAAFRHAIRLAVGIALGEILSHFPGLHRSYWIPMTIALVLKPEYGSTLSRGLMRIGGTIAGLLLATVLFHFLPPTLGVEIIIAAVFMFLLRWIGVANYGLFSFSVGGLVVVMIALTGAAPEDVIIARGVNTVIGGLIALVIYWLWPTWESTQISEAIARMIDSYREYFHGVALSYINRGDTNEDSPKQTDRARLSGRVARSNLQTSAARLNSEPRTTEDLRVLLSAIQVDSNRLAHAVMSLEVGGMQEVAPSCRETFQAFTQEVERTLLILAGALRGVPVVQKELPNLRESYERFIQSEISAPQRSILIETESDRITNSVNTLRELVLRWVLTEK